MVPDLSHAILRIADAKVSLQNYWITIKSVEKGQFVAEQ